ncbi:dihydropteroate synthase [Parasphingorhabdus halotolerans]|nr:dihydropteroate synthase [Parasphingorhabdus halotolerans]
MADFMEQMEAQSAHSKIYMKPVGFLDNPQYFDEQNSRLNNSLMWFSQIECTTIDEGKSARALVPVEQWPQLLEKMVEPLAERATALFANLTRPHAPLQCGERVIRFDQPHVMGILNRTPDSFSDGGKHAGKNGSDPQAAIDAAFNMATAGASIIDIGGESTRPGAEAVWEGDEIKRVVPVIEKLTHCGAAISVDTRKAAVMEAAIAAGAHIINDISALLHDKRSLEVAGVSGKPVVLMHAPSSGKDPHKGNGYGNVVTETFDWLEQRIADVVEAGFEREKIIVDPGLGFGKSLADNLALMNNLAMFHALGQPLLIGASRKRMIGALSKEAPVDQRLGGSIALALHAIQQGAQIVRVHDVPETVQAAQVWRGMRDAGVTARV